MRKEEKRSNLNITISCLQVDFHIIRLVISAFKNNTLGASWLLRVPDSLEQPLEPDPVDTGVGKRQ